MSEADKYLKRQIELGYVVPKLKDVIIRKRDLEIMLTDFHKEQLEKIMKDWKRLKPFIAMDLTKGVDEYMLDNWINELENKLKQDA